MFNLTLIYTLRFFKAGKEMFHYNEKDRNEVNCQHCCGKHPAHHAGTYRVLRARTGTMTDNQRQHAENKGQRGIRIGRKRIRAASMIASIGVFPSFCIISTANSQSGWRFWRKARWCQQTNLEVDVIT